MTRVKTYIYDGHVFYIDLFAKHSLQISVMTCPL